MKSKEINKIRLLIEDDNINDIQINNQLPKVGDMKKIVYGTLSGLECEVFKINKIIVRIDSLQKNIMATMHSHNFERTIGEL